jgi:transcriptional regulator with XRE-family HTH domain
MPPRGFPVPGLKEVRMRALLTQVQLAQRAKVDRNTVARLETGDSAALSTIRKLAEALDVPPAVLIGELEGEALAA